MWVRATATLPLPVESLEEALAGLSPETLAALAQDASHDGSHLRAQLADPSHGAVSMPRRPCVN